ncbi:MAG: hypothetical protein HUU16_20820 [Candidatus Omnitrophica bacterium]|nr:hypothetical protein [Candidatus Omnitrophota bacterium]
MEAVEEEGRSKPSELFEHYRDVIGTAKGLPPDAAVNHDHYLYGMPKR